MEPNFWTAVGNFIAQYWQHGIFAFLIGTGIISISPIKLNPWGWVIKKIGSIANADINKKVTDIESKLDDHIKLNQENTAISQRVRILSFADEIKNGIHHSEQNFSQIMLDITAYNLYCDQHPDFKNKLTEHAAKLVEETFDRCMQENNFL